MAMTPFVYVRKLGEDYQTTLTIGVQTFAISPHRVTQEEADWMGDMLVKALENAGLHGIERRNPYPEDDASGVPAVEASSKLTCPKCGGAGWLWWKELDNYSGPAIQTGVDDTQYPCDACGAASVAGNGEADRRGQEPAGHCQTPSAEAVAALLPRIDAAIQRIVNGQGCMRIPADPEDPDLVLADCKRLLKHVCGVQPTDGIQGEKS